MKAMAQLYMVRHAQASFGTDNYDELSDLGHQQAALLGMYYAERGIEFDQVITGQLNRHKQTRQGVLKHTHAKHVCIDAGWDEFDFEGIVGAYLLSYPSEKPSKSAPRSQWYRVLRSAMIAWSNGKLDMQDGESWQSFCERVERAMKKLLQCQSKRVLVVSSGGTIAVFLKHILGISVEQAVSLNLQIKNTSMSEFFFNQNGIQLSAFNHVPHLDTIQHKDKITFS